VKRVSFRIYPDRAKSCYYVVHIFHTEAKMYEHFRRTNIDPGHTGQLDFRAICQGWSRYTVRDDKRLKRHPEIGQILFWAGNMGAGVVSHELTHATTYWAGRRTRLPLGELYSNRVADERYAWALGHLVAQFWTKYWQRRKRARWLKA